MISSSMYHSVAGIRCYCSWARCGCRGNGKPGSSLYSQAFSHGALIYHTVCPYFCFLRFPGLERVGRCLTGRSLSSIVARRATDDGEVSARDVEGASDGVKENSNSLSTEANVLRFGEGDGESSPTEERSTAEVGIEDVDEINEALHGETKLVSARIKDLMDTNPVASFSVLGIAGFLGFTFLVALVRTVSKGFSKQGRRNKTVNKNKLIIQELEKYLPEDRDSLNGGVITGLRLRSGFSPTEIFRKYLWFLLRERKFDNDALADVIALKNALSLSEKDVSEALNERASRIFEKYGTVMLDTSGMSPAGVERKATARSLFSKMLYLVECDDVLGQEFRDEVDLRDIFGATEDDVARLRIASLYELDLDAALSLPSVKEPAEEGAESSDTNVGD